MPGAKKMWTAGNKGKAKARFDYGACTHGTFHQCPEHLPCSGGTRPGIILCRRLDPFSRRYQRGGPFTRPERLTNENGPRETRITTAICSLMGHGLNSNRQHRDEASGPLADRVGGFGDVWELGRWCGWREAGVRRILRVFQKNAAAATAFRRGQFFMWGGGTNQRESATGRGGPGQNRGGPGGRQGCLQAEGTGLKGGQGGGTAKPGGPARGPFRPHPGRGRNSTTTRPTAITKVWGGGGKGGAGYGWAQAETDGRKKTPHRGGDAWDPEVGTGNFGRSQVQGRRGAGAKGLGLPRRLNGKRIGGGRGLSTILRLRNQ